VQPGVPLQAEFRRPAWSGVSPRFGRMIGLVLMASTAAGAGITPDDAVAGEMGNRPERGAPWLLKQRAAAARPAPSRVGDRSAYGGEHRGLLLADRCRRRPGEPLSVGPDTAAG
jgi:hypothetical protein